MQNTKTDTELVLHDNIRQEAMKNLASIISDFLMEKGFFTTCLNCAYWNRENEMCNYYKQRPPAKVIVVGCETHTDIPF